MLLLLQVEHLHQQQTVRRHDNPSDVHAWYSSEPSAVIKQPGASKQHFRILSYLELDTIFLTSCCIFPAKLSSNFLARKLLYLDARLAFHHQKSPLCLCFFLFLRFDLILIWYLYLGSAQ